MITRFIHWLLPTPFRSERVSALACTNVDGVVAMLDHGECTRSTLAPGLDMVYARPRGGRMRSLEGWAPGPPMTSPLVQDVASEGSVDLPAPPHQHGDLEDHQ